MNPNLIVIHGLKYSGKSTVADRLISDYGYVRVKFADPLKNMLRSLLRDAGMGPVMIERVLEGDLKEAPLEALCGKSSRDAMTTLGNEWRDMMDERLWSVIARAKVESLLERGKKVVIDDLRYPVELATVKSLAPATWVVTRGGKHFIPYSEDQHPSERPMSVDLFDQHLPNHFSIESLYESVDRLMPDGPSLWGRVKRVFRVAA